MPSFEVEEFAKLLVENVRDEAIADCEVGLDPSARSLSALRWRRAMENGTPETFAKEIIPDCVDEAIFFLLRAIDEGRLRLLFVTNEGKSVDLAKEGCGEMAGWYVGTDGWKMSYSKQRSNDAFTDIGDDTGLTGE